MGVRAGEYWVASRTDHLAAPGAFIRKAIRQAWAEGRKTPPYPKVELLGFLSGLQARSGGAWAVTDHGVFGDDIGVPIVGGA